mmetsp:Transcript_9073/g.15217  ORF Transcript_9073/g.15217 Transcript_9073/m.15217 type:complete len:212 (+) Transcript_9073:180-815(+)
MIAKQKTTAHRVVKTKTHVQMQTKKSRACSFRGGKTQTSSRIQKSEVDRLLSKRHLSPILLPLLLFLLLPLDAPLNLRHDHILLLLLRCTVLWCLTVCRMCLRLQRLPIVNILTGIFAPRIIAPIICRDICRIRFHTAVCLRLPCLRSEYVWIVCVSQLHLTPAWQDRSHVQACRSTCICRKCKYNRIECRRCRCPVLRRHRGLRLWLKFL